MRGVMTIIEIIFLISQQNICCDPSLEPVLMMGHKICFYEKICTIIPTKPCYPFFSEALQWFINSDLCFWHSEP